MKTIKVQPWSEDQGDYVLINEEDFDASLHSVFEGEKPAGGSSDDHTGDDEAAKADLAAACAEYEAKLGKKAFHGWDAATLREKIAAA